MKPFDDSVSELRRELAFLERGGYRVQSHWRMPLFFEDSQICRRRKAATCPASCALMTFVPTEFRDEAAPCRHIPLNEAGETLHSMYTTETDGQIEAAVKNWLIAIIGRLGPSAPKEKVEVSAKAA